MKLLSLLLIAAGICLPATLKLGAPLKLKEAVEVDKVAVSPESYLGKTVQVKGKVTEVCEMMGCWMNLADLTTGKLIKIKVKDGDVVFPKESIGKVAIAEGKLVKFDLTREQAIQQARHEAEEQGRKFDPTSVRSGTTIYQIQGAGAVIFE